MAWSRTVSQLEETMRVVFRRLSGKDNPSYGENLTLKSGMNQGMVELAADMRRHNFKFMESATTVLTTSGTEYVDLSDNVFAIVPGTVRISSEDVVLYPISVAAVNAIDPDRDESDVPATYWLEGASGNAEAMSIHFLPTPNGAYTVQMQVLTFPTADVVTGFPSIMAGLIKDKALSIALPDLGFFQEGEFYRVRASDAVTSMKKVYDDMQPEYIKRSGGMIYSNNLEGRIA